MFSRNRNRGRNGGRNRGRNRSRSRNRNQNSNLVAFNNIMPITRVSNGKYLINCNNTGFREATIFRKIRHADDSKSIMFQFISNNSQKQEEVQVIDYNNCLIKCINTNENLLLKNFDRFHLS